MATQAATSTLPRLMAKPLAKISHATGPRDSTTLRWMHLKERDDLVVALDHVRVVTRGGQYVERRVIRVVCGADMVDTLDLDDQMQHPSMDLLRRGGTQIALDQLPLGILVRPPNLRMTYWIGYTQKRLLQLKFCNAADCQEMATALEQLGLPVRAATSGDRPTSQRWPLTTSSWSSTPPSSQSRKTWSSHDSSSQTARAYENPSSTEHYRTSSPFGSAWSGLDVPQPSTTHGSGPPTSPPMFAASLHRPHSPPALATSRDVAIDHASSSPARPPVASSGQTGETLYSDYTSRGHQVGDHPSPYHMAASTSSSSSRTFPIQRSTFEPITIFEAEHGALPSSSHHTLGPGVGCHWEQRDRPASSSRPSRYPASDPLTPQQRPWTVHEHAAGRGMAPPPLPDRLSTALTGVGNNGRKRGWAECPSPGRRSTRLASKYTTDGGYEPIQRPTSTVPTATEMPPRRELPFDQVETSRQAPAVTNSVAPSLTSMGTAEHVPGPGPSDPAHPTSSQAVEPASQHKGKSKTTRSPRKTPARPARPAKTSARNSTGRFTKGSSPRKGRATAVATQEVSPVAADPGTTSGNTPTNMTLQTDQTGGTSLSSQLAVQATPPPPTETTNFAQAVDQARPPPPFSRVSHPSAIDLGQQPVHDASPVGTHLLLPLERPLLTTAAVTMSSSPILPASSINHQIAAPPTVPPSTVSPSLPNSWLLSASTPPVSKMTSISQPLPMSAPSTTINNPSTATTTTLPAKHPPLSPPTPRAPTPTLSMSEVEAVFDRRLRETMGAYLARLGPFITEINTSLGKLMDLTTQFANDDNNQ